MTFFEKALITFGVNGSQKHPSASAPWEALNVIKLSGNAKWRSRQAYKRHQQVKDFLSETITFDAKRPHQTRCVFP